MIVGCNWKMNKTIAEARSWATVVGRGLRQLDLSGFFIFACVPFTCFAAAPDLERAGVLPGAQDLHWQQAGPYTGEVAAEMLADAGARVVVVGHSERRRLFGETDSQVGLKTRAALRAGLGPVVCVGESADDRRQGEAQALNQVRAQVATALAGLGREDLARVIVAYEPLWAIGTGSPAPPDLVWPAQATVREECQCLGGRPFGVIYGGGINAAQLGQTLSGSGVDGIFVGGASLDPQAFLSVLSGLATK